MLDEVKGMCENLEMNRGLKCNSKCAPNRRTGVYKYLLARTREIHVRGN